MTKTFGNELNLILKARFPFIYIVSQEENRVEYTIRKIIKSTKIKTVYCWDFVDGYIANPNINGFGARNPLQALELIEKMADQTSAIFLLKDYNKFLSDVLICRKLKNLQRVLKTHKKTIIFLAHEIEIPPELFQNFTIIEFSLPTANEIRNELNRLFSCLKIKPDSNYLEVLTRACQGLTLEKIRQTLSKALSKYNTLDKNIINVILDEKRQIVAQSQILEFPTVEYNLNQVGGLNNLKKWLKIRKNSFSEQAELYGIPKPRGVILAGSQGTGKSLTAKAIAGEWKLPLLQLDTGRLFEGIIGESEKNIRQVIQIVETLSPCILWIDEIDKAFITKTQQTDSGTTNRVMSTFLTWLSERKSAVFVVATANNLDSIPIEIIRKGRFDEVFFVGLPNFLERKQIFYVVLNRVRPTKLEHFKIDLLSEQSEGFSGSEIEQAIIEAMHFAFTEKREFTQYDIQKTLQQIIPLSELEPAKTQHLKEWAESGKLRIA